MPSLHLESIDEKLSVTSAPLTHGSPNSNVGDRTTLDALTHLESIDERPSVTFAPSF